MQDLATAVAYDQVSRDFSVPVQQAGMPLTVLDVVRDASASPDDYRRGLVRQLQRALPRDYPKSITADATRCPADMFATTEAKVREAVTYMASAGETLTPVTTTDRAGREITEFYGKKSAWMNPYKAPVMLTRAFGGAPVKIPVIL